MPRKKPAQIGLEDTMAMGVHNANYISRDVTFAPLERPSARSLPWRELNPAWLAQECINRGVHTVSGNWSPIPGRVRKMERVEGGWNISCYLGPPSGPSYNNNSIDLGPGFQDYTDFFVTDAEVEAGQMLAVAA